MLPGPAANSRLDESTVMSRRVHVLLPFAQQSDPYQKFNLNWVESPSPNSPSESRTIRSFGPSAKSVGNLSFPTRGTAGANPAFNLL